MDDIRFRKATPDDLEDLYAASLEPFADSDEDGFTDLEETLNGSNPADPAEFPSGNPVDLSPPEITVQYPGNGFMTFSFHFPESYADQISFRLFSGPDLAAPPTDSGFEALHTGGGAHELTISEPPDYPVFYRFLMVLD